MRAEDLRVGDFIFFTGFDRMDLLLTDIREESETVFDEYRLDFVLIDLIDLSVLKIPKVWMDEWMRDHEHFVLREGVCICPSA